MTLLTDPASLVPCRAVPRPGRISLVGAGPGAADLLTLRALRCLSQADVVYYDRLVDPEVLAHARPGARRVYVGKEIGAHAWPQVRIDSAIVTAALDGLNVVRLKSGDPMIFGRAAEEIAAAHAHGIEVEVIPGVTAASAAAASACLPLTERGVTDRVVLATSTCAAGTLPEGIADMARPGTMLVYYMAMNQLAPLSRQLAAAGVSAGQEVTVIANASRPDERQLTTTLATLAADCARAGLGNPAVVMLRLAAACSPDARARPATAALAG
jgi:uroporphyrin-III C-methyltransferase/precorrin-2 dehydrogenase/sirohydrochlorin ferrochelatase